MNSYETFSQVVCLMIVEIPDSLVKPKRAKNKKVLDVDNREDCFILWSRNMFLAHHGRIILL